LAKRRRKSGSRIERTVFLLRSVVEKVPHVEEVVVWHAATGTVVQVKETREVTAKLNRVASDDLRGHILEAVRPLIKDAADVRSKRTHADAADFTDAIGRKANRRLRIGANFIPAPSGGIHAKFVEQSRREGVVPDRR